MHTKRGAQNDKKRDLLTPKRHTRIQKRPTYTKKDTHAFKRDCVCDQHRGLMRKRDLHIHKRDLCSLKERPKMIKKRPTCTQKRHVHIQKRPMMSETRPNAQKRPTYTQKRRMLTKRGAQNDRNVTYIYTNETCTHSKE